jgi:hypothetical protein
MKRMVTILGLAFLALTIIAGGAFAGTIGVNITAPDKNPNSGTGWYGAQEDNEVEPGMQIGQQWDLEGFFLKGNTLSIVGGYQFGPGVDGFTSGDIFIDVNGDAKYGNPPIDPSTNPSTNLYGWDYVIDLPDTFTSTGGTYQVYGINPSSWLNTVYYFPGIANRQSNPWTYNSGGSFVTSGSFSYGPASSTELSGYGLQGYGGNENHYLLNGFDLGFIGANTNFTAHYTMECGNDNLIGQATTVPEPGSLVLLGTGIATLGLALRRKKQ